MLSSIEEQGKLTPELKKQILAAETLVVVEDLYRPYRPKRRTRATIAKEKGLEPLAACHHSAEDERAAGRGGEAVCCPKKREWLRRRRLLREPGTLSRNSFPMRQTTAAISGMLTMKKGTLIVPGKGSESQESVYEMYYDFEEPVSKAWQDTGSWP